MKEIFIAKQVHYYIEDEVAYLALALEVDADPKTYVILSKLLDDEDGDGIYINSSFGIEGYNLVEKIEIINSVVEIYMNEMIIEIHVDKEHIEGILKYIDILQNSN